MTSKKPVKPIENYDPVELPEMARPQQKPVPHAKVIARQLMRRKKDGK